MSRPHALSPGPPLSHQCPRGSVSTTTEITEPVPHKTIVESVAHTFDDLQTSDMVSPLRRLSDGHNRPEVALILFHYACGTVQTPQHLLQEILGSDEVLAAEGMQLRIAVALQGMLARVWNEAFAPRWLHC